MRYFLPFLFALIVLTGCKTEDYTKGEPTVCEIHHVPMVRTGVPIVYGLPGFSDRYMARFAASTNAFAHAESYVLGGCCTTPGSAHRAVIFVCPECKRAAKAWELSYDKTH
jgi:hypothetical protein